MASWSDLRARLAARFGATTRDPSWCGIVIDGQRVAVKSTANPDLLLVVAPVCPQARLFPEEALRYNASAERGALVLEESVYALRHVVSVRHADADEVSRVVEALAAEAVRVRRLAVAEPPPLEAIHAVFEFLAF